MQSQFETRIVHQRISLLKIVELFCVCVYKMLSDFFLTCQWHIFGAFSLFFLKQEQTTTTFKISIDCKQSYLKQQYHRPAKQLYPIVHWMLKLNRLVAISTCTLCLLNCRLLLLLVVVVVVSGCVSLCDWVTLLRSICLKTLGYR